MRACLSLRRYHRDDIEHLRAEVEDHHREIEKAPVFDFAGKIVTRQRHVGKHECRRAHHADNGAHAFGVIVKSACRGGERHAQKQPVYEHKGQALFFYLHLLCRHGDLGEDGRQERQGQKFKTVIAAACRCQHKSRNEQSLRHGKADNAQGEIEVIALFVARDQLLLGKEPIARRRREQSRQQHRAGVRVLHLGAKRYHARNAEEERRQHFGNGGSFLFVCLIKRRRARA